MEFMVIRPESFRSLRHWFLLSRHRHPYPGSWQTSLRLYLLALESASGRITTKRGHEHPLPLV